MTPNTVSFVFSSFKKKHLFTVLRQKLCKYYKCGMVKKKITEQTLIKCPLSRCRLWIRVLICQPPHSFVPPVPPSVSSLF